MVILIGNVYLYYVGTTCEAKEALFGGTFNPLHLGHLLIAQSAAEQFGLDRVWFVPSRIPPHKEYSRQVPDAARLEMLRLSIEDNPVFGLLDLEIRREGASYTILTVDELRLRGITGRIAFIIGEDHLPSIRTWKDFDRLKDELFFMVAPRESEFPDLGILPGGVRADAVRSIPFPVSSSVIRDRVSRGESIRYLVPEPVREMIQKEGFYR